MDLLSYIYYIGNRAASQFFLPKFPYSGVTHQKIIIIGMLVRGLIKAPSFERI